ncbi:MAG: NUDIX hydrolase [Candidatus Limnocylindrales bacterium]|jgi:ADP-ribose pyrophosphatase
MDDSPASRRPNRASTGQPFLDSLLDELRDADTALKERVIERRPLHTGRYMAFEAERVIRSDGSESSRDIVVHPGAVVIAPLDAEGRLLLVTQYRVPSGGAMLELPAGTLEVRDGVAEDPLGAAHRELEEETGFRADSMDRIGGFWSAPGFSTEYLTLYLATGLSPAVDGRLSPDDDENLRLSPLPWREAVAAVESGVIEDAKSIAGILWLARRLEASGS